DALAHQDGDAGLGDGATVGDPHRRRPDQMLGTDPDCEALAAALDEVGKPAAKPGDCDLSVRREGRDQISPPTLIAREPPGLNHIGARVSVGNDHSLLIPLVSITCRQRYMSPATRSPISSGLDGVATLPPSTRRSRTSGSANTRRTSWFRRSTIDRGVPAAMANPSQDMKDTFGRVSAMIGASGMSG